MSAISDTLRLAQRWRDAGIPEEQADQMVAALNEELDQGVVTKQDLAIAVRDLKIWTGGIAVAGIGLTASIVGWLA